MSRFPSYDGTRLAYTLAGDGPPLVCVPGGPERRGAAYLGDLGGLTAHRTLVRLDGRGTGGSDVPVDPATYRVDRLVADLEALRVQLGLERIDLFGHSAGAGVVLLYADAHPERAGRLALAAPSPRALGLPGDLGAVDRAAPGRPPPDATLPARAGFYTGYSPDPAVIDRLAARPMLLVAGERDGWPTPDSVRALAAAIPRAEVVVQPGAGHYPWRDDPAAFSATVGRFLADR